MARAPPKTPAAAGKTTGNILLARLNQQPARRDDLDPTSPSVGPVHQPARPRRAADPSSPLSNSARNSQRLRLHRSIMQHPTTSFDDTNRRRVFTTSWHSKWALLLLIIGMLLCILAVLPSVSKYSIILLVDDNNNGDKLINTRKKYSMAWLDASADDEYIFDDESNENENAGLPYSIYVPSDTTQMIAVANASAIPSLHEVKHNNTTMQNHNHPITSTEPSSLFYNYTTDIDLVSLTIRDDFFVLFNNSALTSWLRYIQNVRSVTFIGPSRDYELFCQNMQDHYPQLSFNDGSNNSNDNMSNAGSMPQIRWVNETHWKNTYQNKYKCPYPAVCQQLIKLHVFDLRTHLGLDYIGNNVLIVDSDTVWSRNATFVHPNNGKTQYWEVTGTVAGAMSPKQTASCDGSDPIKFTEGITAGASVDGPRKKTMSPYEACERPEYPNATGARHIVHHMLFQYDVMRHLHDVITQRWNVSTVWEAFRMCHSHNFCQSRVAEYELYFAFVTTNYPERVQVQPLVNGKDYMGASAVCTEEEMKCCRERGVLLKGCHDHRIRWHEKNPAMVGDMCCSAKR